MPIDNAKVKFDGVDIQVNANGVVAHKISIVDDFMPWLSRQAITSVREDDDTQGFDVVMLTGKRVRVMYGTGTSIVPQNNDAVLNQLYRKVLQTAFDINGTSLEMTDAAAFFAIYKDHQMLWGKRAQLLAQIQDPDITLTKKTDLIAELTGLVWTPVILDLMGNSYQVIFGEGMTCQFTNWVVSTHTDFTFNLVQREPIL